MQYKGLTDSYAITWQLLDGNMDDKAAVKAKGLWEDWHMRQLGEQPGRINHRSGTAVSQSVTCTPVCWHGEISARTSASGVCLSQQQCDQSYCLIVSRVWGTVKQQWGKYYSWQVHLI